MDNHIISAEAQESVIHSFMPTNTRISMLFKINGDFSTDPSRTKVVVDEESIRACISCANILLEILYEIFSSGVDHFGVVNVLKYAKIDPLSNIRGEGINDYLVKELKKGIEKNFSVSWPDLYLQPDGVTDADFTRMIEKLKVKGISKSAEIKIPGAIDFFHTMGLKDLPLENSLTAMEDVFCSDQTRANILSDVILNTRIGMSSKMKESIKKAKLIKFESGVKSIDAVKDTDIVDGNFENSVLESVSSAKEYTTFAKKNGSW